MSQQDCHLHSNFDPNPHTKSVLPFRSKGDPWKYPDKEEDQQPLVVSYSIPHGKDAEPGHYKKLLTEYLELASDEYNVFKPHKWTVVRKEHGLEIEFHAERTPSNSDRAHDLIVLLIREAICLASFSIFAKKTAPDQDRSE